MLYAFQNFNTKTKNKPPDLISPNGERKIKKPCPNYKSGDKI